jgi:hypothetical protein
VGKISEGCTEIRVARKTAEPVTFAKYSLVRMRFEVCMMATEEWSYEMRCRGLVYDSVRINCVTLNGEGFMCSKLERIWREVLLVQ